MTKIKMMMMMMITQGGSPLCLSLGRHQLMLHSMLTSSDYHDNDDDEDGVDDGDDCDDVEKT